MNNQDGETDQDIAEDVLPAKIEEKAVPVELNDLYPWHRPRKQLIRRDQWLHHSSTLIDRLMQRGELPRGFNGNHELRYLTLPGTDYLDVRLLADCCRAHGCTLASTGFLAANTGNPSKARAEIRQDSLIKAGHISDQSFTVWRRLEEVSSVNSNAYQEIRNRGPFQIINIDACGSPAPVDAQHAHRMIDAIYRVIELQLSQQTSRWLLFLTVDVRNNNLNPDTLEKLKDAIRTNAAGSLEFRRDASELFAVANDDLEGGLTMASNDPGEYFVRLFSLGLAKWFIHLVQERQWGLKMHGSYFYSTADHPHERPTMPCLAFEFIPPPPGLPDRLEVARAQAIQGGVPPDDLSMRALVKVAEMEDLDTRVREDENLRRELISETRGLLSDAGYSAAALDSLNDFL